ASPRGVAFHVPDRFPGSQQQRSPRLRIDLGFLAGYRDLDWHAWVELTQFVEALLELTKPRLLGGAEQVLDLACPGEALRVDLLERYHACALSGRLAAHLR